MTIKTKDKYTVFVNVKLRVLTTGEGQKLGEGIVQGVNNVKEWLNGLHEGLIVCAYDLELDRVYTENMKELLIKTE